MNDATNDAAIPGCEEALRLLALYLDDELGADEHAAVHEHLGRCRSCYSRAEFERRLKSELGQLRREDVRPAFEQRVRELISQFASSPADAPSDE
jgi:anti-sigma factor RsiW